MINFVPFLLSTSDKEVYSVSLFIYILLPKISPNKAYLMIYSLLKGKLIYNNHLIINFLKRGFRNGIHNNWESWLFQRGHFCYPFCTAEGMKPTEPRWGLMWHNHFEVLFVFTGWPTPHQKESPSPNWSTSKLWGARKRYNRFRSWIPQKLLCSTEIALVGSPPVQAESGEPGSTKTASAWALTSDRHITVGAESTALSPSSWQSPAIWGSTRIQIALTLALGQSHFPDKMLKMAIKVIRTQINFMPSLLTLHGPIVLADM